MNTDLLRALAQDFIETVGVVTAAAHRAVVNVNDFLDRAAKAIPPEIIEGIGRLPEAMRGKMALQRRLLKRGVVPSDAFVEWSGHEEMSAVWVAETYAGKFDKLGHPDFARPWRSSLRSRWISLRAELVGPDYARYMCLACQRIFSAVSSPAFTQV